MVSMVDCSMLKKPLGTAGRANKKSYQPNGEQGTRRSWDWAHQWSQKSAVISPMILTGAGWDVVCKVPGTPFKASLAAKFHKDYRIWSEGSLHRNSGHLAWALLSFLQFHPRCHYLFSSASFERNAAMWNISLAESVSFGSTYKTNANPMKISLCLFACIITARNTFS